jgi:hypothetical protein
MKSILKKQSLIFPLFAFFLSLVSITAVDAQVHPAPVPAPAPPLPPATNPAATPGDTSSIRFQSPAAPNQPQPAAITPPQKVFPKSKEDTVFRSIDLPPSRALETDSAGRPKK